MRDVRIVDGEVVNLPDNPACYAPFARIDACLERINTIRYGYGHRPWCPIRSSERSVLGSHTNQPLATVHEHGSRVEVLGLVPWFVPQLLDFNSGYWLGDTAPRVSSADTVLGALQ